MGNVGSGERYTVKMSENLCISPSFSFLVSRLGSVTASSRTT